jgi:O-antigen/teichoic acid export membrane protein
VSKTKSNLLVRVAKHTGNFGTGRIIPKVIGFILIPIYTNYLTPEEYGLLDICTTIIAFLSITMRLGLPGSVTRFYYDFEEGDALKDYVTTVFIFLIGISLLVASGFLIFSYFYLDKIVKGMVFFPFAVWIAYKSLLTSNTDIQRRLLQAREQSSYSRNLSIAMLAIGLPISIYLVVVREMGINGVILSGAFTTLIFFVQAQYYLFKDLKGNFTSKLLRPSLNYGIGVLPSHLVGNIAPMINQIILASYVSVSAVGLYGVGYKFVLPFSIITFAFSTAFVPIYFSTRKQQPSDGIDKIKVLVKQVWFVSCVLFLGVSLLAPPLIKIMTPPSYHEATKIIIYISFGFLGHTLYTLYGQEVFFQKKTKLVPIITISSVLINIVTVILFAKEYGVFAVAIGASLSYWVSFIITYIITNRFISFKLDYLYILKTVLFMGLVIYINTQVMSTFQNNFLILSLNIVLIAIFVFTMMFVDSHLKINELRSWRK